MTADNKKNINFNLFLKFFKREFSNLINGNSFELKPFKNSFDTSGYFSTTSTKEIYYNKEKLLHLLSLCKDIDDTVINNTAIFFAHHEFTHTIEPFLIFYEVNWNRLSKEESSYYSKEYLNQTYFSFRNLKYIIEEFFIERTLNKKIKRLERLYKMHLIRDLNKIYVGLEDYYSKIINDTSLNLDDKKKNIKKYLLESKKLGNIIELSIRLYGLDHIKIVNKIIKFNILNIKDIILKIYLKLFKISIESLDIPSCRFKLLEIFSYLDKEDILSKIIFQNNPISHNKVFKLDY